jgi:predicted DNA-binding transcriptional regulator AlpA
MTKEYDRLIGKDEVCEILKIGRATLDRWRDPNSEYYRADFPKAKRYEKSFVCFWYLSEILAFRDTHLTPA